MCHVPHTLLIGITGHALLQNPRNTMPMRQVTHGFLCTVPPSHPGGSHYTWIWRFVDAAFVHMWQTSGTTVHAKCQTVHFHTVLHHTYLSLGPPTL